MSSTCWTCRTAGCDLYGDSMRLGPIRTKTSVTANVTVAGKTKYRLAYGLRNGGDGPNYFSSIIGSIDKSFPSFVLENLTDSSAFAWISRELGFSVPPGTRVITVTFEARHVRNCPPRDTCFSYVCRGGIAIIYVYSLLCCRAKRVINACRIRGHSGQFIHSGSRGRLSQSPPRGTLHQWYSNVTCCQAPVRRVSIALGCFCLAIYGHDEDVT